MTLGREKQRRRPSRSKGDYTQPRRLIRLCALLHSGGVIRPAATAKRFGISVRTLQSRKKLCRGQLCGPRRRYLADGLLFGLRRRIRRSLG